MGTANGRKGLSRDCLEAGQTVSHRVLLKITAQVSMIVLVLYCGEQASQRLIKNEAVLL